MSLGYKENKRSYASRPLDGFFKSLSAKLPGTNASKVRNTFHKGSDPLNSSTMGKGTNVGEGNKNAESNAAYWAMYPKSGRTSDSKGIGASPSNDKVKNANRALEAQVKTLKGDGRSTPEKHRNFKKSFK